MVRWATKMITAFGMAALVMGCNASSSNRPFGDPAGGYQFGPYDGPQGYHGGVFSG